MLPTKNDKYGVNNMTEPAADQIVLVLLSLPSLIVLVLTASSSIL
jgi:hypothetical protein